MNNNIWDNPKPNKIDISFIGLLTTLLIVFMVGYLQATQLQNFGTIYFYLTIVVFIFLIIALFSRFEVFTWVIYGKSTDTTKFLTDVGIGIVAALVLYSGISGFSIAIPLAISSTSPLSAAGSLNTLSLITYVIIAFYGPLIEEIFWAGLFVASFGRYLQNNLGYVLLAASLLIALLITFLGSVFLGEAGIAVGVLVLVLSIFLEMNGVFKKFKHIKVNKYAGTVFFGAIIITALHVYAYGNLLTNLPLFQGAFFYFIIEGVIIYYRQSIIPSIMMHTVNNALIGATILGIPTIIGIPSYVVLISLMFLFLFAVFRLRKPVIGIYKDSPYKFVNKTIKGSY